MQNYILELVGTALLVLLGDGVVANVCLKGTKGNSSGWIVITTGWAIAVAVCVFIFGPITGAHLNPAVTIALAVIGNFAWAKVPGYIIAQILGGILGGCLVYINYLPHWKDSDADSKLGVFCTMPAIRNTLGNSIAEFIATFVFLFGILAVCNTDMVGGINPLVVGLLVFVVGLCCGGTTGYAMNPARDLGPRIAHAILPIPGKRDSDWGYAWIPVVMPILGGVFGALAYVALF